MIAYLITQLIELWASDAAVKGGICQSVKCGKQSINIVDVFGYDVSK